MFSPPSQNLDLAKNRENQDAQTQNWVFTIYTMPRGSLSPSTGAEDLEFFRTLKQPDGKPHCSFSFAAVQFSLEQCPDTGRLHYQGVARTYKKVRWSAIDSAFPHNYWAPMKDTWAKAANYTVKNDTHVSGPYSFGIKEHAGLPSDLSREVIVWFGGHKVGKTRVWRIIGDYLGGTYLVPGKAPNSSARWLGNYDGQPLAIIDEYNYYEDFSHDVWKQLLDNTPHELPAASGGRSVLWNPQVVLLLTNRDLEEKPDPLVTHPAFEGRVTEIFKAVSLNNYLYGAKRKFLNFTPKVKVKPTVQPIPQPVPQPLSPPPASIDPPPKKRGRHF